MSRDHRKLKAFQLADEFVLMVYCISRTFPPDEKFGLTSQLRRAAVSVAANIVEGCAKPTHRDYIHFLGISLGSLREAGYYLELARKLEYFDEETACESLGMYDTTARTLSALIRALRNRPSDDTATPEA